MPAPLLLLPALGSLVTWLGHIFVGLLGGFLISLTRKFTFAFVWNKALFIFMIGFILLGTISIFPTLLGLVVQFTIPSWLLIPASWVIPANIDNVIGGVLSTKIAVWLMMWQKTFIASLRSNT